MSRSGVSLSSLQGDGQSINQSVASKIYIQPRTCFLCGSKWPVLHCELKKKKRILLEHIILLHSDLKMFSFVMSLPFDGVFEVRPAYCVLIKKDCGAGAVLPPAGRAALTCTHMTGTVIRGPEKSD